MMEYVYMYKPFSKKMKAKYFPREVNIINIYLANRMKLNIPPEEASQTLF